MKTSHLYFLSYIKPMYFFLLRHLSYNPISFTKKIIFVLFILRYALINTLCIGLRETRGPILYMWWITLKHIGCILKPWRPVELRVDNIYMKENELSIELKIDSIYMEKSGLSWPWCEILFIWPCNLITLHI